MSESNFKDELEEVWVPKDVSELEALLLTIQNEPGKRILKQKIQQAIKEKAEIRKNWGDTWDDWDASYEAGWDDWDR